MTLLSFDMESKYHKGAQNTIADAVLLLLTFGSTNIGPDLDFPCLLADLVESPPPPRPPPPRFLMEG